MRKHYDAMKRKAGLIETEIEDCDRLNIDEAFSRLRPGSPYKLTEMLHPQFNPKRKLEILVKEGKSKKCHMDEP
jgi:hypothetical protein